MHTKNINQPKPASPLREALNRATKAAMMHLIQNHARLAKLIELYEAGEQTQEAIDDAA
jgi:hypothetical protein